MDIGKAFTFVFDDKDWIKKIAIGGIVTLIPIVNFIATGYGLRVLKNVAHGQEQPLPEWDDWGGDFVKGALIIVASLIYALPAILLSLFAGVITALLTDASGDAGGVAALCILGVNCLTTLWGIAVALWMPAAIVQYASKDDFGAFFKFDEIWASISNNLGSYAMAIVVTIIAGLVGGLGAILCVIGVIFTTFYAQLVGMHALGQFATEAGIVTGNVGMDYIPPAPSFEEASDESPEPPETF